MVKIIKQNLATNKKFYIKIKRELRKRIDKDIPIDHIGSTVIPKMIGKNIIDVLIGANNQYQLKKLSKILCNIGYFPNKKSKNKIYQFFASRKEETRSGDVHIHLVMLNTDRYDDFLTIKNYLLNNKDEALAYANCKKEIVNNITVERKEYRSIKSEYVTKLFERAKVVAQ